VAVGESVAAHVQQHEEIAVEPLHRLRQPPRQGRWTVPHVHEHRVLAEELGHPGLGEAHAARAHPRGVRRGENPGPQLLGVRDLLCSARARQRIDRAPLPRDPAHHRPRARVEAARLGGGEGAHHVAATADAEHQRAARCGEKPFGVAHRSTACEIVSA
jgi:hypothetical protein